MLAGLINNPDVLSGGANLRDEIWAQTDGRADAFVLTEWSRRIVVWDVDALHLDDPAASRAETNGQNRLRTPRITMYRPQQFDELDRLAVAIT